MKKSSLILYDFLLVKGGAEAVTLALCEQMPQLDLCVGFVNSSIFSAEDLPSNHLVSLTSTTHIMGWQSIKVTHCFESAKARCVENYDKVIFSGSNAPMAVKHRNKGGNILYCHTPPRFIYDLKQHYLSTIPLWQRPLLRVLIGYMQPKFERAMAKMDLIIANSINIQKRIKHYLDRDSIVIYPPCPIDKYYWQSQGDYYLSTARVEPYKRVRAVVEAFIKMPDKKLVVASGGSELEALKQLAIDADNIEFTGWCESDKLYELVANCIATIYLPLEEDFGMSPVESMAAGKPVIGVAEGGVMETVLPDKTGVLCPAQPKVADIILAVEQLSPQKALAMRAACEQRAKQFSSEIFFDKMDQLLAADTKDLLKVAQKLDASC